MTVTFGHARALLIGVLGVLAALGLAFVGFVALLVLAPIGLVAFLVLRHRMRVTTMERGTYVWTGRSDGADVEGVVVDVTVEEPDRLDPPPR